MSLTYSLPSPRYSPSCLTVARLCQHGEGSQMCIPLVRAALMCASIALAALSSVPANAELPRHHKVVTLGPTPSDHASDAESGFPIFSGFGTAVAIRNGIAFVGIPHGFPTSRVAVYEQTAADLQRTTTLTVPDALL